MQLLSFRTRMVLLFGVLGLAILAPVFWYVDRTLTRQLTAEHGRMVLDIASSIATMLGENLNERRREVELLSRTYGLRTRELGDPELRRAVDRLQSSYPAYSWIGIADAEGAVRTAVKDLLVGASVKERPWFVHGQHATFLGDVHEALLLAKLLPRPEAAGPVRFIDVATPIFDEQGSLRGVLGTHIDWRWSDELVKRFRPDREGTAGIEIFIVDGKGKVIYPDNMPENLALELGLGAQADHLSGRWSTAGGYVSAIAPVKMDALVQSLGWRVVVRQPNGVALLPVYELQMTFIAIGGASALLFVIVVMLLARNLSRPLEELAGHAKRIESGEEDRPLALEHGSPEIRNLADALHAMTATLIRRRQEVAEVNRTLEDKVQQRTAELERANTALKDLARRDALTGLNNRLAAEERLHEEWLRMQRSDRAYGVMMLDIDYFKRVNDTYGHDAGDVVLQRVAATLKASLRATDFVARFGGEEFLVLLPEASAPDVGMIAEKIRRAVERTDMDKVGKVTVSVGATLAMKGDDSEDRAVKIADERLYAAKHAGRNRVVMEEAA